MYIAFHRATRLRESKKWTRNQTSSPHRHQHSIPKIFTSMDRTWCSPLPTCWSVEPAAAQVAATARIAEPIATATSRSH